MWSKNYRLQNIQLSKIQMPYRHLVSAAPEAQSKKLGGEYRDRTGDPLVANQVLSQLS
jgi:hypothetical protein